MTILAVTVGGSATLDDWRVEFARQELDLEIRDIADASLDPRKVSYALCYYPPPGRLAQFENLRAILSLGAGVDHILQDPDWPESKTLVRMGSPETAQRMAEYVVWACLGLARDAKRIGRAQMLHEWDNFRSARTAAGCRVGLLGLGTLGRAAASALIGLGFIVSGWSRSPKQLPGVRSYVGDGELASMVGTSDILVSMLPNTPMLNGVIDRKLLSRLPEGAGLVNVGRGEHVVLPDLLRALDDGALCGAVLDVFPTEPLPTNDPIWDHPKVTVTSHLASITSLSGVVRFVKQGLRDGWPAGAIYDARAGY